MDHVMHDISERMVRPVTDWAIKGLRKQGWEISPLTKEAIPHVASRAMMIFAGALIAATTIPVCPPLAVAALALTIYASVDFVRVVNKWEKTESDWGDGLTGVGKFALSMNPTVQKIKGTASSWGQRFKNAFGF